MAIGLLFPPVCPVCEAALPLDMEGKCCKKCSDKLVPIKEPKCFKCGKPLESTDVEYCELCRNESFSFVKGVSLYPYTDLSRELVLKLKYNGRGDIARFFANQIINNLSDELLSYNPDVVIPVPVHKKRLVERGYNQAMLIAKHLSDYLKIPCCDNILIRSKDTAAQKQLGKNSRLLNLYDAFSIDKEKLMKLQKKTSINNVLLVDDIYTSGSTIQCCTMYLMEAGIKNVYFVAVCT